MLSSAQERTNASLKALERAQADALQMVETTRGALQEVGVSRHAIHFQQEANRHEAAAKVWLGVTGGVATLTAGVAVWNYIFVAYRGGEPRLGMTGSPVALGAQVIVAKVLLFSILLSAIVWCGRMYRAHRHNAVVNRHRQNALSSFETFVQSTGDEQTKNAVLVQATQSIFAQQPSGYSSQDPDTTGPAQILEILRTTGTK
jgi:hypothetical protein